MMTRMVLIAWMLGGAAVLAQEQTGVLQGRVSDASGGVLPGVTVTVSSEAVLGGTRTTVTGDTGTYRIPNLPVGTYEMRIELAGFEVQVVQGIRVQAGTTYTVDGRLGVGNVAESVTVTGESPVIDSGSTAVGFTFTTEIMNTVPNARDAWAMVSQAPGVTTSAVNVGGTQTGNQLTFRGHGVDPRQNTYILAGANVTDNSNNGASQFYFDVDSFDEMQVQTSSHNAEVQTPGMVINVVPKSGSNQFRGAGSVYFGNESLQSNNVDDDLRARGVDRASNLNEYLDAGFDIGGPIVRDKLWFWGAYRWQEVENFITGTSNPDGTFPIDRTVLWYPSVKISWRPAVAHNVSGYFNLAEKARYNRGLSALRPLETTQDQSGAPTPRIFAFRDDWTVRGNFLVSAKVNVIDAGFRLDARPGVDTENTPARMDQATGVWGGGPPNLFGVTQETRAGGVTASYFRDNLLGGSHDFRLGFDMTRYRTFGNRGGGAMTIYPADHRLIFFNGAPLEVLLFQSGAQSVTNPSRSAYAQDSFKLRRLTLNLGLRWDWQTNRLNEAQAPTSRYFNEPVTQQATGNLVTWNTFAPRAGIIYDLFGTSKTLLKASYARYFWQIWTDKGNQTSAAGDRTFRYTWNDLNADRQFTQNEAGSLLSVDDPATRRVTVDPDLKATKTDELTVGLAHELLANVSVTASLMQRKDSDLDWRINREISPADYTPVNGTDPGPDGRLGTADDGGALTFYELASAKRALSPNFITSRPGFTQEYRGFEVSLNRRFVNGWQMVASFTAGKQKENYGAGSFQNPQDIDLIDDTRIASSVPHVTKLMGSYQLPRGLTVSGFYQHVAGTHFTRTVNSSTAIGRTLAQGNVTALSGRRNEDSYDPLNLLDLRLGYELPFARPDISLAFDVFNVLNINTVTSVQVLSGTAYNRVLQLVPPRILRFGGKIRF
jgi:hypothetical protein